MNLPSFFVLDPKIHRDFAKIPNFFFPKVESYSDITTATFIFLTCSFGESFQFTFLFLLFLFRVLGLIGIILAMALLLYRVNSRARHQRQIQDHIETIHAILGKMKNISYHGLLRTVFISLKSIQVSPLFPNTIVLLNIIVMV